MSSISNQSKTASHRQQCHNLQNRIDLLEKCCCHCISITWYKALDRRMTHVRSYESKTGSDALLTPNQNHHQHQTGTFFSFSTLLYPFVIVMLRLCSRPIASAFNSVTRRHDPAFQHAIRSLSAYHFDTFKFVERLEAEGFSREQSEAIMASLREVISERYISIYWDDVCVCVLTTSFIV